MESVNGTNLSGSAADMSNKKLTKRQRSVLRNQKLIEDDTLDFEPLMALPDKVNR
jgi:hypothetical protein